MQNERGTVERALRLISYVATVQGNISVKAVSEEMGLPQSTAHRLVQQLMASGFLQRSGQSRTYEFGPAMYRLGAVIGNRVDLVQIARPALERIVQHTNEGCALGLYNEHNGTVAFAEHLESPLPLRYRITLYEPVLVLWGASGRCILAFQPSALVEKLCNAALRSPTDKTLPEKHQLIKELGSVRAKGYATSQRGEKIQGASGISAPIFGLGGKILGCLSLTIPQSRYPTNEEAELGQMLIREAAVITHTVTGGLEGSPI
jgi:DNA-binding IclR family transcriptional regulator